MEKLRVALVLALLSAMVITIVPMSSAAPAETLIWQEDWLSSDGTPVTSPVLEYGRQYRIVAKGWFISCVPGPGWVYFAADAQYYTLDFLGTFNYHGYWATYLPAPGGQSFLQINGMPVNWGPFSNGDPNVWGIGHEYTTYYVGEGAPITFAIVDVIDGEYTFNFSHMEIKIYKGPLVAFGKTAYAYGGDYATGFLSLSFKNWGWTNGPLGPNHYEFPIYAGAAKCDITKGTLVGTLIVDYDGSTATVTYLMDAGWTMGFAQLYVDGELLPRDIKGRYTVSPGQYPYIDYVDGPTHTFTVSGLSGDIYVIAHTDVFEV